MVQSGPAGVAAFPAARSPARRSPGSSGRSTATWCRDQRQARDVGSSGGGCVCTGSTRAAHCPATARLSLSAAMQKTASEDLKGRPTRRSRRARRANVRLFGPEWAADSSDDGLGPRQYIALLRMMPTEFFFFLQFIRNRAIRKSPMKCAFFSRNTDHDLNPRKEP